MKFIVLTIDAEHYSRIKDKKFNFKRETGKIHVTAPSVAITWPTFHELAPGRQEVDIPERKFTVL